MTLTLMGKHMLAYKTATSELQFSIKRFVQLLCYKHYPLMRIFSAVLQKNLLKSHFLFMQVYYCSNICRSLKQLSEGTPNMT